MYTSNDELIESVENFIGKLPDSMIKSHVEKWLAEVRPTGRITSEQLEKFVSFSTHLPKELQNYPQTFASWVKNGATTEIREAKEGTVETANLGDIANDSIEDVDDVDAPDNEEETLHTLGTLEGSKGGKKITKAGGKKAKTKHKK